jgi:predicted transcriptional regulator
MRDVTLLLGFRSSRGRNETGDDSGNRDVAKLFFDSFSKRLEDVETDLRGMASDFEKLKLSAETNQISDLVLLERLQKSEAFIRESLNSLKIGVEKALAIDRSRSNPIADRFQGRELKRVELVAPSELEIASNVLSPTGEIGSLPSITTPTELHVLTLLVAEGPKSAPEIGQAVGRSREHTARLMKKLYEEGYIRRDQSRIPFRYSVVDRIKQAVKKPEAKDEEKEPISVPQP